jgi:type IV pilus assembly protein PilP
MRNVRPLSASGWLFIMLASILASACSPEQEELRQWMEQQAREVKPRVDPLSEPKKFLPEPYAGADGPDPFSAEKLSGAAKAGPRAPNPLLTAELSRRKEPLEAYPLDTMSMVGSVSKRGQPIALLQVDRLLYSVKVGDYIGQNYGRVVAITETELTLREVVQDAAGEWVERMGALPLQEKTR